MGTNIIEMMETEGTHLNTAWTHMPAPEIARTYWRLRPDSTMLDVIKQVAVDETNHRDVNRTFASMARDDPNPYVGKHAEAQAAAAAYWQQLSVPLDGNAMDFLMKPKVRPSAS